MPSKKSKQDAAADTATESAAASAVPETGEPRVDLAESLAVGTPELAPVPATFSGINFSIRRYYPPEVIWKWSDLQRGDTKKLTAKQIAEGNRELMKIVLVDADHDKIGDLLSAIGDRSVPEARRVFGYINNLAGLTDKWGNLLPL